MTLTSCRKNLTQPHPNLSALDIAAVRSYVIDLLLFILWGFIVVIAAIVRDLSCLVKVLLLSGLSSS